MATRGPGPARPSAGSRCSRPARYMPSDQGVRAGSARTVTPPAHTLPMVITAVLATLGVAVSIGPRLPDRVPRRPAPARPPPTSGWPSRSSSRPVPFAQQAAHLEARLGMEREHTVTAAADMAAKLAGEKLGDTMAGGTRQLDLRTTAFEKRVEGSPAQLERLGDVV